MTKSIGWSDFARGRHGKDGGFSWFDGTDAELEALIEENWDSREPGAGAEGLDDVVVVPVPADKFRCAFVRVDGANHLQSEVYRRQEHEEPFIRTTAEGLRERAMFAKVVLYAAHELEKNDGKRSTDCDWEVVCIIASPVEDEPMHPLAMARNQLEKPGGTPRIYTSEEWAESVWYWSQYVTRRPC
jgi:hypothetical protein